MVLASEQQEKCESENWLEEGKRRSLEWVSEWVGFGKTEEGVISCVIVCVYICVSK